ncbi:hypothetical protein N658DRAFT_558555 [Parathielavia hyrcaniae]|uniref:Uncharacterized protein n=1 Tax=Parathielavia hyrcaniae TaxID=113614 RepID=A0AAN6Q6C9_9PEZI|nr:hypothetical protein N658DRAFT_558555 [Parathielavia hyrcaniae]
MISSALDFGTGRKSPRPSHKGGLAKRLDSRGPTQGGPAVRGIVREEKKPFIARKVITTTKHTFLFVPKATPSVCTLACSSSTPREERAFPHKRNGGYPGAHPPSYEGDTAPVSDTIKLDAVLELLGILVKHSITNIDAQEIHAHVLSVITLEGSRLLHPSEFREGPKDIDIAKLPSEFFEEVVDFLVENDLADKLGLQAMQGQPGHMIEFSNDLGSLLLDEQEVGAVVTSPVGGFWASRYRSVNRSVP